MVLSDSSFPSSSKDSKVLQYLVARCCTTLHKQIKKKKSSSVNIQIRCQNQLHINHSVRLSINLLRCERKIITVIFFISFFICQVNIQLKQIFSLTECSPKLMFSDTPFFFFFSQPDYLLPSLIYLVDPLFLSSHIFFN